MEKQTIVKIPASLKEEIQYYRKKNKANLDFDKFTKTVLEEALQNEILRSVSKLELSYRCKDNNPKIIRRTFTVMGKTDEYFLCEKCAKESAFQNLDSEESIKWGDYKPKSKSKLAKS